MNKKSAIIAVLAAMLATLTSCSVNVVPARHAMSRPVQRIAVMSALPERDSYYETSGDIITMNLVDSESDSIRRAAFKVRLAVSSRIVGYEGVPTEAFIFRWRSGTVSAVPTSRITDSFWIKTLNKASLTGKTVHL